MGKKLSSNYLDFIPCYKPELKHEIDSGGNVTIFKENKGVFYFITQKFLKKPRVSQIHLDEMGSFVWPLIDGKNTVADIATLVKEHFGEKAEPLYDRLLKYMDMLENCGFIVFTNKN